MPVYRIEAKTSYVMKVAKVAWDVGRDGVIVGLA